MRSVGYSDLFVLSKKDMWDVLKEYPAARVRLEAIAVKRLEKYKRAPLEKGELGLLLRLRSRFEYIQTSFLFYLFLFCFFQLRTRELYTRRAAFVNRPSICCDPLLRAI